MDAMTGISSISVLYRGVFVQDFSAVGLWGIQGSIDVDPKKFKPRLNREGFIASEFPVEIELFLRQSHPKILLGMATRLADALKIRSTEQMDRAEMGNALAVCPS